MKDKKWFYIRLSFWGALFAAGVIGWLVFSNESAKAWRALLINFVFFTPAAAGLTAWPAIVKISNGRWSRSIDRLALSGISFSVPSVIILILLWIYSGTWAPWIHSVGHEFWLTDYFLFGRDILALLILWTTAIIFIKNRNSESNFSAGIFLIAYCLAVSLIGYDLIMALLPEWSSALFGAYIFITGLYAAAAIWTVLSLLLAAPGKSEKHDLGKIILTFCLISMYFAFSQLLPIWYENLPEETIYLVPLLNFIPWSNISYLLLGIVYIGPVLFLLPAWSKVNRWYLLFISLLITAGLWIERWWLVGSVFQEELNFGLVEISMIAAFTGLFVFGIEQMNLLFGLRRDGT